MNAEQVTKALERIATEAKGSVEKVSAEVAALKAANADLIEKSEGLAARFQEFEQNALCGMRSGIMTQRRKSLGAEFAESESFRSLVARESKNAAITKSSFLKNLVNDGADSTGDDAYPTQSQRDPRLANDPRRRLTLLEALPTIPVTSSTFDYVSLNGYANSAAEQSGEGVAKAETSMPIELKTVRPATIAHWLPASEQVLSDVPQLSNQISSLLAYGVRAKAESLIVAGSGIIQGLEQIGTAFNGSTGESMEIAISAAQADMEADGWMASHVLLNPADWHAMRTRRRGASDDAFVVGSWMNPPSLNAWGLAVVTTPSVSAGTAIVLDANQVAILDRQAVTVEAFRQDGTNVQQNLITIRGEARIGFACFAPTAVRLVTTV